MLLTFNPDCGNGRNHGGFTPCYSRLSHTSRYHALFQEGFFVLRRRQRVIRRIEKARENLVLDASPRRMQAPPEAWLRFCAGNISTPFTAAPFFCARFRREGASMTPRCAKCQSFFFWSALPSKGAPLRRYDSGRSLC